MKYRGVRTTKGPEPVASPFEKLPLNMRPDFGDLDFPPSVHSEAYKKELKKLQLFYCSKRSGDVDPPDDWVRHFVSSGNNSRIGYFFGDCGIGKSWYLRYTFEIALPREGKSVYFGILDMRKGLRKDIVANTHLKLHAILSGLSGHQKIPPPEQFRQLEFEWNPPKKTTEELIAENYESLQKLQEEGLKFYCIIDNVDMQPDDEQVKLAQEIVSILTDYPNVYMIIPLRLTKNTVAMNLTPLGQFSATTTQIPPIDLREMLRLRLEATSDGKPLQDVTVTANNGKVYTCPSVFKTFCGYEPGTPGFLFWKAFSHSDSRRALELFEYMFYSNRINGDPDNVASRWWWISALMRGAGGIYASGKSKIINILDNDKCGPGQEGKNSLIRFRVLEYISWGTKAIDDALCCDYFKSLQYTTAEVREVLRTLFYSGLIQNANGGPEEFDKLRDVRITNLGHFYLKNMLRERWYLYMIKRTMIADDNFMSDHITYDIMDDEQLVDYIENEEGIEKSKKSSWEEQNGKISNAVPTRIAPIIRETLKEAEKIVEEENG